MAAAIETKNRLLCEWSRMKEEVHRGVLSMKSKGMRTQMSRTGAVPVSASVEAPRSSGTSSVPPPNDVLAGAAARAASQSTIHPIDTIKVRASTTRPALLTTAATGREGGLSVISNDVKRSTLCLLTLCQVRMQAPNTAPKTVSSASRASGLKGAVKSAAGLYKGVGGAAFGAGLAIGTYFAFYGAATRALRGAFPDMNSCTVAFFAGAVGALGSSFVKVPAAVCIRSVQAGLYPNVIVAASKITKAAGPRGLYTGYTPTVLEDIPDMAFKFAAYETLGSIYTKLTGKSRSEAQVHEDLLMGGMAGAFAAAATTPVDVVKTRMMCSASSRPTIGQAVGEMLRERSLRAWFRGVGPRAVSNGMNSAVFFCIFEIMRNFMMKRNEEAKAREAVAVMAHESTSFNSHDTASISCAVVQKSRRTVDSVSE